MSWIQKLYETYERCIGHEPDPTHRLMPVCHTTQKAQVEIVLDGAGLFRRARVLDKSESSTLIPCTEKSGGRSGKAPINHPLCDKLQYLAADFVAYGGEVTSGFSAKPFEPHRNYLRNLSEWATSAHTHPKLGAILTYVKAGHLIQDLVGAEILVLDKQGRLKPSWDGDKGSTPNIFKALSGNEQIQSDAFIRWAVESADEPASGTWQDSALIAAWIGYCQSMSIDRGFCMVTGQELALAVQHPAKLRHGGDKAKLISANDTAGFTFRGRFRSADEALGVASDVTQKAHSALRWLISGRHGYYDTASGQTFVVWSSGGQSIPDPFADSFEFMRSLDERERSTSQTDTAQAFAATFGKAVAGYRARLDPTDDIMVLGLDSATPGRMAITFYRELNGSEFLDRISDWHRSHAWPQNYGKERRFVGAPAPRDIAEAAYGRRLDDRLRKATVERILPCIIESVGTPLDLMNSAARRACNRVGFEGRESEKAQQWEKCLGIACALIKGHHKAEDYQMTLELDRNTRDYAYGRLLAIAESIESYALDVGKETRDTTAARLMQRFADHPFSTWRTIELALKPYMSRLRAGGDKTRGFLIKRERLLDELLAQLDESPARTSDKQLSPEFLLGYHCQRQALRKGVVVNDVPVPEVEVIIATS